MKKIIAVILCLALLLQFSVCCFAAETTEVFYDSKTHINPLYSDVIDETFIEENIGNHAPVLMAGQSQEYCETIEEAGAVMREQLLNRAPVITVYFVADKYDDIYFNNIFNEAVKHTGEPTEGDYLLWQYGGWDGGVSYRNGDKCYMTFKYNMVYYTTAQQEAELDVAIESLLDSLDLDGKDDYQKVCAIYDYICDNVTYDYDNLYKDEYTLKYSAYAALINKTSVCQGYANLFYRLALEEGVDARLISGWGDGGAHGWNIVQMGDYYYNLDATWDAGSDPEDYEYFLRCEKNFGDHVRDFDHDSTAFHAEYPMGTSDYVYDPDDFTKPEDPIPSYPENKDLKHFPTIDLTDEDTFFVDSRGAKFYISLYSLDFDKVRLSGSEELRNIIITSNGNVSAKLVDYDPETMADYLGDDEDNKFVTYKVWDSAKRKDVITGVSYFEAKGIAKQSANYSVVPENAVNIIEITVGENYSSVWKEGMLKISATINGQEYATALTFISDVVVFEYEEVNWAAKNDGILMVGGDGYSDYFGCFDEYVMVEGATVVSTTAFRAIEGKNLEIYANEFMAVVLNQIAAGQQGVNFSNYFNVNFDDKDNDFDWDMDEDLLALEFGFYGDQIIKGQYQIDLNLPITYYDLREMFGLDFQDVVSYYVVNADEEILYKIKVDYTYLDTEEYVSLRFLGENNTLGEYKIVVEVPAIDEEIIDSGYCGGEGDGTNLEWVLSEDGTLTISGTGAMGDYFNEWSEEAQDYVLNRPWEAYKDQIKKLVLGEGITRIGSYSFCQLYNAQCELVIPSTVKVIGNSAFWDSNFVGELVLPEGLKKLESYALINNEFTYVYIPSTLTEMEYRVFWNHWDLERFEVSEKNPAFCDIDGVIFTKDKKELVYYPCGDADEYSIPEGTEIIRENAFSAFSFIDLYIPASVKLIKPAAFRFFEFNLTIDEDNEFYGIVDNALYGKSEKELIGYLGGAREKFVVPEGTKVICANAFLNKKIGQLVLPKSVEKVENSAFGNFSGDVFVEGRIENVEHWAFGRGQEDINIFFMAGAPYNIREYAFDTNGMVNLCYLEGTEILWDFDENGLWNGYDVYPFEITGGPKFDSEKYVAQGFCGDEYLGMNLVWNLDKEGTLTISGEGAMADYRQIFVNEGMYSSAPWGLLVDDIKAIVIEEGVTHIGDSAFYGWSSVKDVTIPASVESIGNIGFFGKSGNFYVEGQLEFVETVAFGSMNKMTNVYFMGGAPVECEEGAFGEGNNISNIYYIDDGSWEFDANGLWNGYKVNRLSESGFVYGDINKDGKVDVRDVYMARIFAAKLTVPTAEELELGDVDGNGRINVIDANLIRKFALQKINRFPIEA